MDAGSNSPVFPRSVDLTKLNRGHRFRALAIRALAVAALLVASASLGLAEDVLAQARSLAYSGKAQREAALDLLKQHLTQEPDDTDARVFYGIVLSWQGRYDEAREQLSQVLAKRPDHGDALPALINVELWSDHPARAEQLARDALARQPDNVELLLAQAHALRNMGHRSEAIAVLDHVLQLSPGNVDAIRMRSSTFDVSGKWDTRPVAEADFSYYWYSDGRSPLRQSSLSLRVPTPVGSITGTENRADQFGLVSYQTDLEFYPHFRPGTYGYLEFGYSADGNLFPGYRGSADLFQSIGNGFELSGGYRHLQFSSGVDIYTFALAKYRGKWLFTGRGFVTPGSPGTSGTALLEARRFFGSEGRYDYIEFRYSVGASPALANTVGEVQTLTSQSFHATLNKVIRRRWALVGNGGLDLEQQAGLHNLRRYQLEGSIYYRF
jgi:YaiO family outer membrane protein